MRPSPTAGQAALEYVAVISLVAAVLVIAAPAVGAPSIASQVARAVRLGICVVAADYCRAGDAEAERLPACTLASRVRGREGELSIANFRLGSHNEWNVSAASDGSVTITHTKGGDAGMVAGLGLEAPWDIDVGAEVSAGLRFREATSWRFDDRDTAKRFIASLPGSASSERPAWHSVAGGTQVAAAVNAKADGAFELVSAGAALRAADGVRFGPGETMTVYGEMSFSAPELKALGFQVTGPGNGRIALEYTFVDGEATQIAFRSVVPGDRGNRATETLRRLDLRSPGNRFVAEPLLGAGMLRPPTPGYLRDLRRVLDWIETEGTTERATYEIDDSTHSFGITAKLGEELGFQDTTLRVAQHLVDATARTPGSARERSRFDCLDRP